MKTTVEPLEGNKVKLSIEVDEAEFDKALDAAFRKIARDVRVPGFRPGKTPRRILEARIGSEYAREQALRDAIPEYLAAAVRSNDIDLIATPQVDLTAGAEEGPVSFDATVEVRPEVTVPGYGSLRVELMRPTPTDEEVDAQIDRLRKSFGELADVDRPAVNGDNVSIDLWGGREDEALPGLNVEDWSYEVGSGGVVAELDEELIGSEPGDALEFSADHPVDGQEPIEFRVKVKQVRELVLPELTDDWAKEASDFETVDALRADITRRMTIVRAMQARMALAERTAEAAGELVVDEVPDPLVNEEMRGRLNDLGVRLQNQGASLEQYLAMSGQSPAEFSEELKVLATNAVRVDLALRAVATAENIEADDDDLDAEYARIAERAKEKITNVRKAYERNDAVAGLRAEIRKRKALEWLTEHVEIVDPEGQAIDLAELTPELDPPDVGGTVDADAAEEAAQ
ncbi:MAG: trigger factor [Acidimicrobiales bacterium]